MERKTLEDYLAPLKAYVSSGQLALIPEFILALGATDSSFPREAVRRLPRTIFTKHPDFTALGHGVVYWPKDEREAFGSKIRDCAQDARQLESAVQSAHISAQTAIEDHKKRA